MLCYMEFVETPIFTAAVLELLSDEEYREFQNFLIKQPDAGDVIEQTGGLRKVRWSAGGKGKRGGVRVIYFYVDSFEQFRMLLIYKKGIKDDLTKAEKRQLKAIKDRWQS
jgi:mRNA-degrading endonuclease RelE of RelBE toxin-antitoxin system